ncbi:hypothetical protein CH267_23145 [Rhodococcus sp. 06-621-2]|nr:ATP-binding cassette domain-containing protein [Rhodococcus sp. 06-621-2]OZC49947.1 hypothetical protein CH267_23145 [Rhodococcus sp. 06-621-2]
MTEQSVAVSARGIAVRRSPGMAYGPLDLEVEAGGVTVLVGPAGEGRTALLLTLAGRMSPSEGTLTVFGRGRTRDIFADAAVAGIDELDSPPYGVTVGDLVTERIRWDAPWYRLVRKAGSSELDRVCAPVFGPRTPPSATDVVGELGELDGLLLRIALADSSAPRVLVVGDLDRLGSAYDRDVLLDRLVALGEQRTVITASSDAVDPSSGIVAQISVVPSGRHEQKDVG